MTLPPMFLKGVREAVGVPGLVMTASFLGFGSLVHGSGLSLWAGVVSTASSWALPGQVVMVELYGGGASLLAIAVGVLLTNARLLPMTVTLVPLLRRGGEPAWWAYAYAHLIALTSWAMSLRRCLDLPGSQRLAYFLGFALTLWMISLVATAAGFALSGVVPVPVTLGLVFINPLYFLIVMVGDLRHRPRVLAIGLGAVLGPPLHYFLQDWGLLLTGLIAGTAAYYGGRERGVGRG